MCLNFWKRRVPKIKRSDLDPLELKLVQICSDNLPDDYRSKMTHQLKHLPKIRRYDYKNSKIVELYPESLDSIPTDLLFERTQEFQICKIKYVVNDVKYAARLTMVLGSIFEIEIKPKPKFPKGELLTIVAKEISVEKNLTSNIQYY